MPRSAYNPQKYWYNISRPDMNNGEPWPVELTSLEADRYKTMGYTLEWLAHYQPPTTKQKDTEQPKLF